MAQRGKTRQKCSELHLILEHLLKCLQGFEHTGFTENLAILNIHTFRVFQLISIYILYVSLAINKKREERREGRKFPPSDSTLNLARCHAVHIFYRMNH